jgi:hypothetical protein
MPLVLPESVTVRLTNVGGQPLRLANVILRIDTHATRKNDISLFPFATDSDGVVRISKEEMQAEVSATYDSGLMDYSSIESADSVVEIRVCSMAEIKNAITSRSSVWTSLLPGEQKRWRSIGDLIALLSAATNARCEGPEAKVHGVWNQLGAQLEYEICIPKTS